MKTFVKRRISVLDYEWDWSLWLGNDTIAEAVINVPENLIIDSFSFVDGKVTVWISGGLSGVTEIITCAITTVEGRVDSRSAIFEVVEN